MAAVRFRLLAPALLFAAAVFAGSAVAYVCHPAARGTHTVAMNGAVKLLAFQGRHADFLVSKGSACQHVSWNTVTGAVRRWAAGCAARQLESTRVGGARITTDQRGRPVLEVGRRALPLPTFARSVGVDGNVALVEATHPESGVFAVRLTDGAFTFLGPDGRAFSPRIDANGALFHDGENKRALREGRTIVKFVARLAIAHGFAQTTAPLVTDGPIRAISMDGLRVAVAVGDPRGVCDRVLYWNVAWRPAQQISAPSGPTCLPGVGGTRIDALAIGGFRTEWLARSDSSLRLMAGSPRCQEWVVRRLQHGAGGEQLAAVAADGSTMAFATTTHAQPVRGLTSIAVVAGDWRPRQITTGLGEPRSLAVDHTHIAVLWPNGVVEVRTSEGKRLALVRVGAARALALEGTTLVALRGTQLDVFDTDRLVHVRSIRVPAGATGLDVQYGVAAFAHGRDAVVVDLASGRTSVVGRAPRALVGVQIEGPGVAYAWSVAGHAVAKFVPTIRISHELGLAPRS